MERYVDGDEAAFKALHSQLEGPIRRTLGRWLENPARVDDGFQITLLKMHHHRDRYRRGAAVLPWVLTIAASGYGKRVPVSQFRLQKRGGKGTIATKFKSRNDDDRLAALRVVGENDELTIVTTRGIMIRQAVNAIPSQSRSATGVRVQRLDAEDAIAAVALVPAVSEDADESQNEEGQTEEE